MDGSVYMIACPSPASFKIGFTRADPRKRLAQLQTGCPMQLTLMGWCPGDRAYEKELHRSLAPYRLTGEWFDLHPDVNAILMPFCSLLQFNNMIVGHTP